jgi:predicted nucleic acid-binding protein
MTDEAPIYLDANVFIDFIEGAEPVSKPLEGLMRHLKQHPGLAITSELTLAEVLAPTKGRKRPPPVRRLYMNLVIWGGFIDLHAVSRRVLFETANLRATHVTSKLKLADAIHLATAVLAGCRLFVSRDRGIPMPEGMRCIGDAAALDDILRSAQ